MSAMREDGAKATAGDSAADAEAEAPVEAACDANIMRW